MSERKKYSSRHLLIAGGGHASLPLIKMGLKWKQKNLAITLISAEPFLVYTGTLPQYMGGFYDWSQTHVDLQQLSERYGVRFIRARILSIQKEDKTVTLSTGTTLSYDILVINVGASTVQPEETPPSATPSTSNTTNISSSISAPNSNPPSTSTSVPNPNSNPASTSPSTFGPDQKSGLNRNTGIFDNPADSVIYPVKPLPELIALREKLSSGTIRRLLIAGGGAAGTELALNLSHPSCTIFPGGRPEIHLIEHGSRILSSFPKRASRLAGRILFERSVYILTHTDYKPEMAAAYDAVILSIGNQPVSSSIRHTFETGHNGRIMTGNNLLVTGETAVFAAGDTADPGGKGLPQIGVHAVKQGIVLRKNIGALLDGGRMSAYRPYPVNPLILSNGPGHGLIVSGSFCLSGRWPSVIKHLVDMNWLEKYTRPSGRRQSPAGHLKKGISRSGDSSSIVRKF